MLIKIIFFKIVIENIYCCNYPSYLCYYVPRSKIFKSLKKKLKKLTRNQKDVYDDKELFDFLNNYEFNYVDKIEYDECDYRLFRIIC
jgi:hypothetical protein